MKTRMILVMAAIAACGFAILFAQQRPATPYTAEQAAAARAAYQTNCAVCHAADMAGRNEAAQLAGSNFFSQWGERTAGELINFIRSTMPPGAGGSLPDQTYINLAAFVLDANSARPGDRTLTTEAVVSIRAVASGQRAAYLQPGAAGLPPTARAGERQQGRQAPRGITVAGEVKNYVPVTDAMLRNQDPGDWLMIRRDYQANYYSPLNQITAQSVNDLRLVWSWA